MDASVILKALDLLFKVISGQNPIGRTRIQLRQNNLETYFNVPCVDNNDYPAIGEKSRIHFRVDIFVSHPEAETIHEAKLFLTPRQGRGFTNIYPTGKSAQFHGRHNCPNLTRAIDRFEKCNPPFSPVQLEAKKSKNIIIPGYLDIEPNILCKTDKDVFLVLVLQIGIEWIYSIVLLPLQGTGTPKIHKELKRNQDLSYSILTGLGKICHSSSKSYGSTAKSAKAIKIC